MTTTIAIEGVECYAYHGCLEEEAVIGGNYSVDVYLDVDINNSFSSDELSDTFDYVLVHDVVRNEMAIQSKLIEHVAVRILKSLQNKIELVHAIEKISVRVTKYNPPVNGQIKKASVFISANRNDK